MKDQTLFQGEKITKERKYIHLKTLFYRTTRPISMKLGTNHPWNFLFYDLLVFFTHSIIFHSFRDATISVKDLQLLTCTRHLWPLSKEDSFNVLHLMWHGSILYNSHLRGPVTITPNVEYLQWSREYLYKRLRSVPNGDRIPISRMRRERSTITALIQGDISTK